MEIKGNINAGYGNIITGSTKSSIVGGESNSTNSNNSFIGGGYDNYITSSNDSTIVGGNNNRLLGLGINNRRTFIGGGINNTITASTTSIIGGGEGNTINGDFIGRNSILGGQNNTIFQTNWSTIGGGFGNTIDKLDVPEVQSNNNFIGGGINNQIYNGSFCNIVGGYQNYINGFYNYSFIGGGRENQIIGYSKASFIGGGYGNLITNFNTHYSQYASIVGGLDNGLTGSSYSTISGGRNNRIVNTIQYYGHNFIGNGLNNTISGPYGGYSTIIGGYNNSMISNYGGSILGGNSNTIFGSPLQFPANSSIVGGFNNTIQLSDAAFIGAGNNNYIRGQASVILGGTNNTIGSVSTSRNNCSILGGINNTIQHNSSHIIGSNITSVAANTTHVENHFVNDDLIVSGVTGMGILSPSTGTKVHIVKNGDALRLEDKSSSTGHTFMTYYVNGVRKGFMGVPFNGSNNISIAQASNDGDICLETGVGIVPRLTVKQSGNVGIGTENPNTSALLELSSTSQGLLLPRLTAAEASAVTGVNGLMIYVTSTNGTFTSVGFWGYEGGAWVKL